MSVAIRSSAPSQHEMMVYQTMAKSAAESKLYKGIGDESGIMMIMLAARELGIPSMQALNGGLNIIQGKVEISARMMNALIRKAGHQLTLKECTENLCTIEGKRCDTGETQTATFSVAEAQKAGLVKAGGGWQKFPKDMCYARALSRLARQLFSDVIGIGYVEGEIKPSDGLPDVMGEIKPLNDQITIQEIVNDHDEEARFEKLMDMFDKEDRFLVIEYMQTVMKHFGWSQAQCVDKFLEEKSLIEKFNAWKSKRKVA